MDIKERSVRYCVLLRIEATPTPVPVPVPATAPAPTSDSGVKEEAEPIIDQAANRKGGISNWRIEEMEALKEGWSDVGSEQNAIEGEGEFVGSVWF